MCVTIVKAKEEVKYNMAIPLEQQLKGSKKIVVNYVPKDPSIDSFLDEIEKMCKNGISANLNITFNHNNNLSGAKAKNKALKLSKDLDVNELIKLMAALHSETDRKLEDIAKYCIGNHCDE